MPRNPPSVSPRFDVVRARPLLQFGDLVRELGGNPQALRGQAGMAPCEDEAGELLEVIKHITQNVTPPAEACTTRKAMYNGINELIDDLMEHISLENNVLFPRALAGK